MLPAPLHSQSVLMVMSEPGIVLSNALLSARQPDSVHRYAPRLGMHAVRGAGCLQHCLQSPLSCSNSTILLHTPSTAEPLQAARYKSGRAPCSVQLSSGCCCVIPPGCFKREPLAPLLSKHELSQNLIAVINDSNSNKATLSLQHDC